MATKTKLNTAPKSLTPTELQAKVIRALEIKKQMAALAEELKPLTAAIYPFIEVGQVFPVAVGTVEKKKGKSTLTWLITAKEKAQFYTDLVDSGKAEQTIGDPYLEFKVREVV